jgi:hypothetical protein
LTKAKSLFGDGYSHVALGLRLGFLSGLTKENRVCSVAYSRRAFDLRLEFLSGLTKEKKGVQRCV